MRKGKIRVELEVLRMALILPDGVVFRSGCVRDGYLEMEIEHKDLVDVEGDAPEISWSVRKFPSVFGNWEM